MGRACEDQYGMRAHLGSFPYPAVDLLKFFRYRSAQGAVSLFARNRQKNTMSTKSTRSEGYQTSRVLDSLLYGRVHLHILQHSVVSVWIKLEEGLKLDEAG